MECSAPREVTSMGEGVLDRQLKRQLIDALLKVPGVDDTRGRNALFDGIPHNIWMGLTRSDSPRADLTSLLNALEKLGRLDNGERPVVIVASNAADVTQGSELGRRLATLQAEIEKAYGFEAPLDELPDTPEVLIFGGEGEWVANDFMQLAQAAGRQVARLSTQRFIGGRRARGVGVGTGWLVAPRLMLTNHHVIAAREKNEAAPTAADFKLQGENTVAWFDYHVEGRHAGPVVAATGVVADDAVLDYALLRLEAKPELADRTRMPLAANAPLQRGARLNIVQCPGGGPLRFAIRNNFCVGSGDQPHKIRYLTDTKSGSSGAPVLDDNWQVVAMHRGAKEVKTEAHRGEAGVSEVAKFHNEGIAIHEILRRLPAKARKEIEAAQQGA
jgi:V8-like Glu-specific endopeptidase